jgi:murein DD-endopeptidase MepM/ murein hydrolase activator NlpD
VRSGVAILVAALAGLAAASPALADTAVDATTVETTAPATTTPATTTALTTVDTTATTAETTTTVPPSTADTTATAPPDTATAATKVPRYAAVATTVLGGDCASAGAAAIVSPGRRARAVGAGPVRLGAAAYRKVVRFRAARAGGASCRPGTVSIRSLSLFGGAVTADSVVARNGSGTVDGLRVAGLAVSLPPGNTLAIGTWGEVETRARVDGTLTAPLAVRLLHARAGLRAGTVVLVGYTGKMPAPAAAKLERKPPRGARHKHRHGRRPLKVTPPLGQKGYVLPVAGGAAYADTYGAKRGDISDGWHHGDDLFAPLGTPVVAVADGTLTLVGWERLGGWRLWLTDASGNEFYYAHLAAYSTQALRNRQVHAGEVLGFLGRTGDAFTTTPHLHFEIHPVSLLKLGYDGAVDPTTYLHRWRTTTVRRLPRPALPRRVPAGRPALEARVVWDELIAAAGSSLPLATPAVLIAHHPFPQDDGTPAASVQPVVQASGLQRHDSAPFPVALVVGLGLALAAALSTAALLRRRTGSLPEHGQ